MPDQAYYQRHRERYIAQATARAKENRALIDAFKDRPCARCRESYPPCVMDLHHEEERMDKSIKARSVGAMVTYSTARLKSELEKCVPVCANCHRIIHNAPGCVEVPI